MNWICKIFHRWEYGYYCNKNGELTCANRKCERCEKVQVLVEPDEYDPVKRVWKDEKFGTIIRTYNK